MVRYTEDQDLYSFNIFLARNSEIFLLKKQKIWPAMSIDQSLFEHLLLMLNRTDVIEEDF